MKIECFKENIKMMVWFIVIFLGIKIILGKCLYSLNIVMLRSVLKNKKKIYGFFYFIFFWKYEYKIF